MSRRPRAASSASTRSTRSRARAARRRRRATCPARASSRRCSRSSKARPRPSRPMVRAIARSKSSSRSTRRTSCSSVVARSTASRTSCVAAPVSAAWASAPRDLDGIEDDKDASPPRGTHRRPHQVRDDPGVHGSPPGHRLVRRARRRRAHRGALEAEERARQAVPPAVRARGREAQLPPRCPDRAIAAGGLAAQRRVRVVCARSSKRSCST